MAVGNLGVLMPWEETSIITLDLTQVARQWRWVNRNPFFTRLAAYPAGQVEFKNVGTGRRPDTVQVHPAALVTDTVLTLLDVTYLQNGDTLELTFSDGTVEMMEIIADPDETASTITVKRGDAFTTAAAIPDNTLLRIVGNARTGAETNQKGFSPGHWNRTNWVQTFQHPVEISGLLQDTQNYMSNSISPGAATPIDAHRMRALENCVDDIERAIVYQRGMSPTDSNTKRAKTKGLRQQIADGGGYIWQPTNYASYGPQDFVRDVHQGPVGVGGSADLFFVSNDFIGAFAKWKLNLVKIDMGQTAFNVTIDAFTSAAAPNAVFINAPRLKPGTLAALNSADVFLRYMRMPTWFMRGRTGDTLEGDVIARIGLQVNNPEMQRYVEGITGFASA